jgi:hypothetical protein
MPTSERAERAAEEVRLLAMDYFGYADEIAGANEVYQKFPVTMVAAIIDAEFPAGDRRKGERREGSSSGADKDYCLADGSYRRKSERRKNTTEQVWKLREAAAVAKARDEERKHVDTVVMQRIEILTSCVAELEGRLAKAVTDALEAAVVRFEFVALEYCERWKVMPKQFIDKGTAAIRGKGVKG